MKAGLDKNFMCLVHSKEIDMNNSNIEKDNYGKFNIGEMNHGDHNVGSYNTGSYNTGSANFGNNNTGLSNHGHNNAGNGNTGDFNTGSYNEGHNNAGFWNYGDGNSGDFNFSSHNAGCFNTTEPKLRMFDKPSDWTYADWENSEARQIMMDMPPHEPQYAQEWWYRLPDQQKNVIKSMPNFDAAIFTVCTGISLRE